MAALELLTAVRVRDAYANLALPAILRRHRLHDRDAGLATELGYGTLRARGLLDAVIEECTDRPLIRVEPPLLDALRLGAYQLLRTRIPAHAAVDTTVELVRAESGSRAAGFVNAILRRVGGRDEAAWVERLAPPASEDPVGHAAFAHAHPRWIAQAFSDALGVAHDELDAALAADDSRPEVHLLARPGDITAEELALLTGGEQAPYSPYGVHLPAGGGDVGDIDAVSEGFAVVQDEGSQLVALALTRVPLSHPGRDDAGPGSDGSDGPDDASEGAAQHGSGAQEGHSRSTPSGVGGRWLDLCAGPGGKAAMLGGLAAMDGAEVDAVEVSDHRAALVRRAVDGLPVTVHVADGRDAPLPEDAYDRVLVDAPCTGLGALRRRPEARWRRRPEDVPPLSTLQRELLTAALRHVRPGGVVAYVTCSPHLAETVGVLAGVLRKHPGVEQVDAREFLTGVPDLGDGPLVQLWPHRHGTDAMFLALLRRRV